MKVGDLIKLKPISLKKLEYKKYNIPIAGIIIDMLEDENGFFDCEVMLLESNDVEWFRDLELDIISEVR